MISKNIDTEVMMVIHDAIFDYLVFAEFQAVSKPDYGKIPYKLPSFMLTKLLPS